MPINSPHSGIPSYSGVLLGSTGNVGREIVNLLVASTAVKQVVVLNRRQTGEFSGFPKVREVVVLDMDKLAAATESAVRGIGATVGFCTIGVGSGSRKMPETEFRKVEVQYPEAFAKGCKAGGVLSLGLMTAAGADNKSSSLKYVRIIGEKEAAVIDVGLPILSIFKPSVILGNSNTPSYLNYVFPAVQWLLPSRYHAIHKDALARAIVAGTEKALCEQQGGASSMPVVNSYEYREMKLLLKTGEPRV